MSRSARPRPARRDRHHPAAGRRLGAAAHRQQHGRAAQRAALAAAARRRRAGPVERRGRVEADRVAARSGRWSSAAVVVEKTTAPRGGARALRRAASASTRSVAAGWRRSLPLGPIWTGAPRIAGRTARRTPRRTAGARRRSERDGAVGVPVKGARRDGGAPGRARLREGNRTLGHANRSRNRPVVSVSWFRRRTGPATSRSPCRRWPPRTSTGRTR